MNHIPSGYQLHINTWENDSDDHSTQIISGLVFHDVLFYLELAETFQSSNARSRNKSKNTHTELIKGLGNSFVAESDLKELVKDLLATRPMISEELRNFWTPIVEAEPAECPYESAVYSTLADLVLGWPVDDNYQSHDGSRFFCRVYDSMKVYLVPQELEDVTDQFYPCK